MEDFYFRQTVLLLVGVVWAAKALIGLLFPGSTKRICEWWSHASLRIGIVIGFVYPALALALYGVATLEVTLVERLIGLVALGLAALASIYFRPHSLLRLMDNLIVRRSNWTVRLISLISLIIGLLLIVVAITDYNP